MKNQIVKRLQEIEQEFNVQVLFACESGSRAWGFDSPNSDYDVRFVYRCPINSYVSVFPVNPNTINILEGDLDFAGWDLRKTLKLFYNSNPSLMEFLNAEIVYVNTQNFQETVRDYAETHHSKTALYYHYLHMAKSNYREYLKSSHVQLKKYLYVLRPLLALKWVELDLGLIPARFETLLTLLEARSGNLLHEIKNLVERKKSGEELDYGFRIDVINQFIESEIQRYTENSTFKKLPNSMDPKIVDELFGWALTI